MFLVEKPLTSSNMMINSLVMEQSLNFKVLKNGQENNLIPPAKGDAGWDLVAASEPTFVYPENSKGKTPLFVEYDTGVVIQPPDGFFTLLFPRSSISKYQLSMANSVGVIDNGYRNTIKLRFRYLGKGAPKADSIYKVGDKIGQLVFLPMMTFSAYQTETLDSSDRGQGGFGSTGA